MIETQFIRDLTQLIGYKVVSIVTAQNEFGEPYFGIKFRTPNNAFRIAWILRDAEGNGPGYCSIQDVEN